MEKLEKSKVTNSDVKVLLPNKTILEIDLPREIESMSSNSKLDQVVICSSKSEKSDIRIYDALGKLIFKINSSKFIDCVWDSINQKIFFSDGSSLFSLKEGENKLEKILKLNRYKYGTSNFSLSPNSKYLGFLKFRAEYDRLHVVDLETKELIDVKLICNHYVWIDDYTVIYSTVHGKMGYYNLKERKKTAIKINIKSILKSKDPSMLDLQNSITKLEDYEKDWVKFFHPIKIEESIYFIIEGKTLFDTALLKFYNSEYKLLCPMEKSIRWYALDDELGIIADLDNIFKSYLIDNYNRECIEDKTRYYYLNKTHYGAQAYKFKIIR